MQMAFSETWIVFFLFFATFGTTAALCIQSKSSFSSSKCKLSLCLFSEGLSLWPLGALTGVGGPAAGTAVLPLSLLCGVEASDTFFAKTLSVVCSKLGACCIATKGSTAVLGGDLSTTPSSLCFSLLGMLSWHTSHICLLNFEAVEGGQLQPGLWCQLYPETQSQDLWC